MMKRGLRHRLPWMSSSTKNSPSSATRSTSGPAASPTNPFPACASGFPGSAAQIAAPGRFSVNSDDGNLNFKKGALFSEVAKVVTEMDLNFQDDYGIFLRARGFYDFELKDDDRRHRDHQRKRRVEQEEQWQALQELGCSGFQGYFFSRPQPPEIILKKLQESYE